MSKLLINEPPLQVLPTLATRIGLNEAIILQQIHFLAPYGKTADGHKWVVKTATEWGEIFPFWSAPTIRRAMANLRKTGIVQTANHNKANYDKTLWWRVDYAALAQLEAGPYDQNDHSPYDQNDHTLRSDQNDHTNTYRKNKKEEEEEDRSFTRSRQPLTRKGGRKYEAEQGTTDPAAILLAHMQQLIDQPRGLLKKYKTAANVAELGDEDRDTITAWIDHYLDKVRAGDMDRTLATRLAYAAIRDAEPKPKPAEALTLASISQAQPADAWAAFIGD